jgi:hypothetical protein
MPAARPRIDLDGVPLQDETNDKMVLAVFRYRTTEGLVLLVPESAELLVKWTQVSAAEIDLINGTIRVEFDPGFVAKEHWLRGATTLVGRWMDRLEIGAKDLGVSLGG